MDIPENGRVVVIDDDSQKEGLPLISSLSKMNIPVLYYTGNKDELPPKPLVGIRMVFLDIILGTDGQSAKNQIATASRIFKSIIDINNGPYLLIAWTKHEEHIADIKASLSDRPPTAILNLEKSTCKDRSGNLSINKIIRKIRSELKKVKSFHLFSIWENLVHHAAGQTVNDFSSFHAIDEHWDDNIAALFPSLAKAYAGDKKLKDNEVVKNAMFTFNGAFIDTLENGIKNNVMPKSGILESSLTPYVSAAINKKLLLFFNKTIKGTEPGSIYPSADKFGTKADLNELFEGSKLNEYSKKADFILKTKHIFLEISPSCDYAQNKLRLNRCVSGVIWPQEYFKKIKKKADFMYETPVLEINGKICKLVFDLRYLTAHPIKKLHHKKPLFRIRYSLLVDIQSALGRHIYRPGLVSV
jgi:hypothetical protein